LNIYFVGCTIHNSTASNGKKQSLCLPASLGREEVANDRLFAACSLLSDLTCPKRNRDGYDQRERSWRYGHKNSYFTANPVRKLGILREKRRWW